MLLQNQEAAERRTFIISRRVWSEGWSWVKSEAVRKPTQLHLISFNFLKRCEGWGEWFFQQQSRRKRKVLKEGEESELYGIFSRGGPFFDGKTPFLNEMNPPYFPCPQIQNKPKLTQAQLVLPRDGLSSSEKDPRVSVNWQLQR